MLQMANDWLWARLRMMRTCMGGRSPPDYRAMVLGEREMKDVMEKIVQCHSMSKRMRGWEERWGNFCGGRLPEENCQGGDPI